MARIKGWVVLRDKPLRKVWESLEQNKARKKELKFTKSRFGSAEIFFIAQNKHPNKYHSVEVVKQGLTSSRKFERQWLVNISSSKNLKDIWKSFSTKEKALKFARGWMKKHPKG